MENHEPPLKGGCGHSDSEVEESALICGVCGGLILLLMIGILIVKING